MQLFRDDRALAIGIVAFVAMLMVVLLWVLLNDGMTTMFSTADSQTSDPTATAEIDRAQQIWGLLPFWLLFVAMLMLISRAVFEAGRPV